MAVRKEENKSPYMSGEFPERECDTENLCLTVKCFGTETKSAGPACSHHTAVPTCSALNGQRANRESPKSRGTY